MGLTYKALKYRDIKMNVTKAKADDMVVDTDGEGTTTVVQQQQEATDLEIEATTSQITEAVTAVADNQPQQFTADHIMKLCLFLAEKSRSKQLQQNQEMNARRFYENFLKEANENIEDDQMKRDNGLNCFENHTQSIEYKFKSTKTKQHQRTPRRTKIKSERFSNDAVLTDKFSNSISSNLPHYNIAKVEEAPEKINELSNIHNYLPQQQQEQQQHQHQDKRDILLKIRKQIFERKRLRQVLSGSGGQRQSGQHPLATHQHQHHHQQQQHQQRQYKQINIDYNSAHLERQDAFQQLADVWRPW